MNTTFKMYMKLYKCMFIPITETEQKIYLCRLVNNTHRLAKQTI